MRRFWKTQKEKDGANNKCNIMYILQTLHFWQKEEWKKNQCNPLRNYNISYENSRKCNISPCCINAFSY